MTAGDSRADLTTGPGPGRFQFFAPDRARKGSADQRGETFVLVLNRLQKASARLHPPESFCFVEEFYRAVFHAHWSCRCRDNSGIYAHALHYAIHGVDFRWFRVPFPRVSVVTVAPPRGESGRWWTLGCGTEYGVRLPPSSRFHRTRPRPLRRPSFAPA